MVAEVETDPVQLLAAARRGDSAARGRLFDLYRNYLAVLARVQIGRRLQGKVDDSDVLQDAFLDAHRHFDQFRGVTEGEFVYWLRRILATTVAQLVRRYCGTQRRDVRLEQGLADELDQSSLALGGALVARHSSPSQQAARRELAVLLADALEQLPADYREVIILSHLQGLPFPEVARRMGRSLDSVKNVWARALVRLRRIMREPV
jgi:RNA polymerase sigma-70 factor (ECF subfamily)